MNYQYQILGTIIASVLNYDQLNDALHEARGCHANSSYAPCDGRSVEGSDLAPILLQNTGTTKVPDLRGKFLRGLNIFHVEGQDPFDITKADPDGLNRKPGQYQPDALKTHTHDYSMWNLGFNSSNDGGEGHNEVDVFPDQIRTSSSTGEAETRPRNIAVYFYIKIN